MRGRFFEAIGVAAVIVAAVALMRLAPVPIAAQAQTAKAPVPKTPWGEPDLQGVWTYAFQIPLQRPPQYAGKEFFSDAEIARLDKERAALLPSDARAKKGAVADVTGAYNSVFNNYYPTGRRTSLIVDPPDGRIPPLTAEAQQRIDEERQFSLALLQATAACKDNQPACAGGKHGPPSPRRAEPPPAYNIGQYNRSDGPEDRGAGERCLMGGLPDFGHGHNVFGGNYRRIVQSPGQISLFVDYGQGQGYHREIPVTTAPHLPPHVRQWWGDSRAHWEGTTLVVDVTNFTAKTNYQESRENLHLIERWTRTSPKTLELVTTMEDPTTWTKPWTVKQELMKQDDELNRIYYEPRCHEGNYGLAGMLVGARAEDRAFAEGRGPDPATLCNYVRCDSGSRFDEGRDPLR